MEQVKIYDYYSFGYNYNILINDKHDDTNKDCFKEIKLYMSFIDELDLRVSKSSIRLTYLQDDIDKLEQLANSPETSEKIVDKVLWDGLIEKLLKVDSVLDAELNTKIAYLLDEKRFSNEILLDKITKLFAPKIYMQMPSIARFDFEESGKCLAFDRYTACAFHALRGTEDVLKMYYEKTLNISATDKDTWGTYETAITNAISQGELIPQPEEQLIINIVSLRKFYRNKTQHPQNTYSSDEAQDLFSLCIKTVNELMADLIKRGKS
ncbi:MAG TPA: hypothetical protein VFJ43_00085 [Bacteroidia bacterium]|nr:hypothetical protein [Bacteroidia bacterium]